MLNIQNNEDDKTNSKYKVRTVTVHLKRNNAYVVILIALAGILFSKIILEVFSAIYFKLHVSPKTTIDFKKVSIVLSMRKKKYQINNLTSRH